ncbi:transcription initiation factor TFIID subunit 8-like [Styela clava]|uniref:transcription initiation factor TFIID subunit 8-like n=1 Tax=Styela clava TaxID=7725 RepID=UPI0019398E23|nr:transcription initiation factor TFIID subunit 8-like [Styela clava]
MSQEGTDPSVAYRQGLTAAIGAVCVENGCEFVRKSALETLTEIAQSYLTEIARSTRQYCEIGGRSLPTLLDIQTALADAGFKFNTLPDFIRNKRRVSIGEVSKTTSSQNPNVLLVGERRNFPTHIPENSTYPKFPDPHTYVRTLTGQEPENNYGLLRERGSSQRWDVERALTRFIAKTGSSHALLPDDKSAFPLIAAVPPAIPYLSALLPCENDLAEKLEKEAAAENNAGKQNVRQNKSSSQKRVADDSKSNERTPDNIDNPYLRPAKTPKLKKSRR